MSHKAKIRIRIRNEEYTVASRQTAERLQAAAAYVDEVMGQLAAAAASLPPGSLAVLAALNIASELIELRERSQALEAAVSGGAEQMLALLEARIGASMPA